ncbi:uncharacterized protein TNCV_5126681 [Trichonephila clavipes]|nr:uncharacterized protein TNCV_5126681 [Trichonephila clavipes]
MESVGIWKRLVLSCSEWNLDLPSSVFPQAEKRVGGKRISWPSERPYLTVFCVSFARPIRRQQLAWGRYRAKLEKELEIYQIRKGYINNMIDLENRTPSATTETKSKLEEELKTLDGNISVLEGKLADFLPCPIALCFHNSKNKAVKRTAEPVIRPAKFTAKATNSTKTNKNNNEEFVFPKKTTKNIPIKEMEKLATTNAFAALNTAENDAEDVSPPKYKFKPIFMRIIDSYNLILQDLHRSYPQPQIPTRGGILKLKRRAQTTIGILRII